MAPSVSLWWSFLSAVAVINIAAWWMAAAKFGRAPGYHRAQLFLSAAYVFGCAFRSFFPVYDIPRLCVIDSPLSTVLVGRTVATLAELCFAAQWALMLREYGRSTGSDLARRIALVIVPLIVVAEICSWNAVLTTANLGHVFENSLWGFSAALVVAGLLAMATRCAGRSRLVLMAWAVAGMAYVAFMFIEDVPMYWARWMADEAAGRDYLTLAQGFIDASACKVASMNWDDWKSEVAWMSLYFSGGVWASLSLVFARAPAAASR